MFASLEAALKPMNSPKDIADNAGVNENTLAYWRSTGIGPRFVKVGRRVLYPREEFIDYMRAHLRQRTDGHDTTGTEDA